MDEVGPRTNEEEGGRTRGKMGLAMVEGSPSSNLINSIGDAHPVREAMSKSASRVNRER